MSPNVPDTVEQESDEEVEWVGEHPMVSVERGGLEMVICRDCGASFFSLARAREYVSEYDYFCKV